ncbi:MAG: hypothetical protein LBR23_09310 [Spirochaetaceae bacterium]|jgi:hypothetical protein|nr:hypothetical protein [Spirochaetaceae bacterium]
MRRALLWLLLGALCGSPALGEDWVLAASAFVTGEGASNPAKAAATLIPQVMLDFFSTGIDRSILPDEAADRLLYGLRTKRQALFLDLSKAVKDRDKFVLGRPTPDSRKSLKTAEQKIADIKQSIQDNLAETDKLLAGDPDIKTGTETIALWKNDYSALYTPPADKTLGAALTADKISGLITGEIHGVDDFAVVSAALHVGPDGRASPGVTEVGRLSEASAIARRLAWGLFSELVKTRPAYLEFEIGPEHVRSNIVISVDDMTFSSVPDNVAVLGGIHSVSFASEGYRTESFSMNFEESKTYVIRAQMTEAAAESITLALKTPEAGSFYINATEGGTTTADSGVITVEVKNLPIFGRFDRTGGKSAYFYIPQASKKTPASQQRSWVVNPKSKDVSAQIEFSRKIMYGSYAALIVSLPVLFYTMGEFEQRSYAYSLMAANNDSITPETAKKIVDEANLWYNLRNAGIGVTAVLGTNFLVQLIIYLVRANGALPEKAKVR